MAPSAWKDGKGANVSCASGVLVAPRAVTMDAEMFLPSEVYHIYIQSRLC